MTSDQGNGGEAELQLSSAPVTPKTPGLNPNANIFHSKSEKQWDGTSEELSSGNTTPTQTYMNGDVHTGINFPPTPESPVERNEVPVVNGVNSEGGDDTSVTETGTVDDELSELKGMLRNQLEYYFSRENLSNDSYLVSQMDGDQFVPITTVANFNQVKKLSTNLELIIQVLRESSSVQVDEKGEKVRPLHKRCIVILREVPQSTPLEEVKALFSGVNCPKFISCEFAHNDNWYITFESDEDAQRAYQYLREDVKSFQGKPIMARIKAKPNFRSSSYMPKNGPKASAITPPGIAPSTQPPSFETSQSYNQPRFPQQQQFAQMPATTMTFVSPTGNQVLSFPFYAPNTAPVVWSPTSPPFFDPGMVFAANGYSAQGFKLSNSTGRHGFQNQRNNRVAKPHNRAQSNPERNSMEAHMIHDRHPNTNSLGRSNHVELSAQGLNATSQAGAGLVKHIPLSPSPHQTVQSHLENGAQMLGARQAEVVFKDQTTQPPRYLRSGRGEYRGRRRREENGAKSNSVSAAKEKPEEPPTFELEPTSFPPLPGSTNSTTTGDIYESKLSDVVKGTAKPSGRDTNNKVATSTSTQTHSSIVASSTSASSNTSATATTVTMTTTSTSIPGSSSKSSSSQSSKDTATMTNGAASLPTPPSSPDKNSKATTASIAEVVANKNSNNKSGVQGKNTEPKDKQDNAQKDGEKEKIDKDKLPSHSNASQGPPKLSYAQMAQRARERAEREATEGKQKPKDEEEDQSSNSNSKDSSKPAALRDNAQPAKPSSSGKPTTGRDIARRDSESKEQRVSGGRRAKENRRERERRRSERDGPKSPAK